VRWLAIVLGLVGAPALAHPLAPSLLDLRESAGGRVEVAWKTTLFRAPGSDPEPLLPSRCQAATARVTTTEAADTRARWTVDCGAPGLVGGAVGIADSASPEGGPAPSAVVRIALADGRVLEGVVSPDHPFIVPARLQPLVLARASTLRGVRHVLRAPDHLLFLLGLVLLAGTGRRLLATVAAFVLAHSLTLTLATVGAIAGPAPLVDTAIAASVLVVAVELARRPRPPTLIGRHPWATATVFGLLHGLAFAAALREAGSPTRTDPLALLGFNAGIEAAQLAFVLAVVGVRRASASLAPRLPACACKWIRWVPVYAMGSLAVFWSIERAAALLR
jgi:hydrogenase/urease accessory protein HupE